MLEIIRAIPQRVVAFWHRITHRRVPQWDSEIVSAEPEPTTSPEPVAATAEPEALAAPGEVTTTEHVVCGEWTLPEVLRTVDLWMERSRRSACALHGWGTYLDRNSWQGIKRITAHCVAKAENAAAVSYEYADTIGWPSHGGLMMSSRNEPKEGSTVPADSVFFLRHQNLPWNVRGPAGVAYECVIVWSDDGPKEKRTPFRFFVTFDRETGKPQPCEFLQQSVETIPLPRPRRSSNRRPLSRQMVVRQWKGFEEFLKESAETEWEKKRNVMDIMPWVLNAHAQRAFSPMVIVKGTRGRVSFGVPLEQCPEFFKDRGLTITNKRGRRAPIVHWVKAHEKHRGGKVIATRVHLRGERRFNWRGLDVSVVIPGLHAPLSAPDRLGLVNFGPEEAVPKGMVSFDSRMARIQRIEDGEHAPTLAEVRKSA